MRVVIHVAVLDDHPAVLAGLHRLLERANELVPVAAVDTADALFRELQHARADVVILDYDLARSDGLAICQRLKERLGAPAVVIYSAYAGPALAITARVAGADALVDKRAPARDLLDAVRRVAKGDRVMPEVPLDIRESAISRLDQEDIAVAAMLLAGTSPAGIADTLATDRRDIAGRTRRIVGRLRPQTTVAAPYAEAFPTAHAR